MASLGTLGRAVGWFSPVDLGLARDSWVSAATQWPRLPALQRSTCCFWLLSISLLSLLQDQPMASADIPWNS
ncbi:hypothetical protein D3C80_1946730 [compost metagenome]